MLGIAAPRRTEPIAVLGAHGSGERGHGGAYGVGDRDEVHTT